MAARPIPSPVTRADGRKAFEAAPPRIRQSDCDRFGGYDAALRAMGGGIG